MAKLETGPKGDAAVKVILNQAFLAWWVITALIVATVVGMYAWKGTEGLGVILVTGPLSKFWVTFLSVIMTWLLAGLILWLVRAERIDRKNAISWTGFFVVSFLYLNILRERLQYGDLTSYIL